VKLHALTHFPKQFREYGRSFNLFGGFFESCIKTMAKRNLSRTTRKHGKFVEELMTRYYEHQVCQCSSMVMEIKAKENEKPPPAIIKDLPKHRMSNSGYKIVWDFQWKRWCTRGKKLGKSSRLFHPLSDKPT
jgi:hypothetical protein